jgi:hypothetical protein
LETTPNLFWVKSKGLLLAATVYKELDGDRFEVSFEDPDLEGVLDGGHNLLAIGTFFLGKVLENEGNEADIKELRKAKVWGEFKAIFQKHLNSVESYLEDEENDEELSTLIPVEMLLPKTADPLDLDNFNDALLEIQIARNNNAQLKQETKSNQEGLYEPLKNSIPKKISDRIEWKSNQEGGEIKAADVVALAWIPLSALDIEVSDILGKIAPPSPTSTYSSKGECVNRYHRYMSSSMVTTDTVPREMKSNAVISALKLAGDLPELFDLIYELFPAMYNNKDGKFGAIAAVKKLNSKKGKKFTKYMEKSVEYRYPEGFINPLVYGLKSLMKLDAKGQTKFNLNGTIVSSFHKVLYFGKWIHVHEHPDREKILDYSEPFLYCLNTSSKEIKANGNLYLDWDELDEKDICEILNYIPNVENLELIHEFFDGGFSSHTQIKLVDGTCKNIKDIDFERYRTKITMCYNKSYHRHHFIYSTTNQMNINY